MQSSLFDLKGRICVITGGLGQLGHQFTNALVLHGARVAVLDISDKPTDIKRRYGDNWDREAINFIACDITKRADLENALEQIKSRWGTPTGLINNAALDSPPDSPQEENGPFEFYPEDSWDRVMRVNVKGTMLACQVIGGAMALEQGGSIINVSSIYGIISPDQSIYQYRRDRGDEFYKPVAYSASKSAIFNLTRYPATYWGKKNVRVNTVTFAGVFNNQDREFLTGYLPKVPMGRMAKEDDFNGTIVYLMSQASSYMTGANIVVDGGFTAL